MLKHLHIIAAAFVLAALTSGCSYLFGPKPDEAKPFVKKSDSACLTTVKTDVGAWLSDGQADIGRSVDCAVGSIDEFSRHVSGKTKNVYTEAELNEFITEYIIGNDSPNAGHVNDFTEQILKFKQIVIGGTAGLITKDELARIKSILLRAKPLLITLSPNIPTLRLNSSSATIDQVSLANTNLAHLFEFFAQEFSRAEDGRPEIGLLDILSGARTLGMKGVGVEGWIPLAESLKALVLAGDSAVLRSREWAPMIRTVAQVWGLAVRAKYNLANNPEMVGRDFPVFESLIRDGLDLLGRSVKAHDGTIPNHVFEKLIDALGSKQMLPPMNGHYVQSQTLKKLLPVIFGKLLYGRWHSDSDKQSPSFGTSQLAALRVLADDWIAGQAVINTALSGQKSAAIIPFTQALAANALTRKSFADDLTFTMAQRAQNQLLLFVSKGRPPIHDDQGRLIVVNRKELPLMQKSDLDMMNLTRVVVEAVITGWTHDASNAQGLVGLTDVETQEVYLDLRELGHDLNFIDVRSMTAGTRTFMENAIFMSSSDGDAYLGLQEGVEWFNFVVSGGKVADRMYHDLEPRCGVVSDKTGKRLIDVLGNQKLEPKCFRREFLKSWTEYMPNLPRLVRWAQQDGSGARSAALLAGLEAAGRNRGASDIDLVDSSEFRSMMPIAHYLESLFARHDVNDNDRLDSDEIWGAFPLLAPFIKKMGNGKADGLGMQKTILSYILEFGTVPSTNVGGLIKLGGWYVIHGLFSQSADREKILSVIAAFPASDKAARVRAIAQHYDETKSNLRALFSVKEKAEVAKITDLFQCLPEASTNLGTDMNTYIDTLAPSGRNIGGVDFVARMKSIIDLDPHLEAFCLPF